MMDSVKLRRRPLERFQSEQQQQQQQRSLPFCSCSQQRCVCGGGAAQQEKQHSRFNRCYSMINELRLAESSQTTSPCCSSSTDSNSSGNTFVVTSQRQHNFNINGNKNRQNFYAQQKQQQIFSAELAAENAGTAGHRNSSIAQQHRFSLATDHFYDNISQTPPTTSVKNRRQSLLISARQNTPLNSRKSLCLAEISLENDYANQTPVLLSRPQLCRFASLTTSSATQTDDHRAVAAPASDFSGIFFAHPVTSSEGVESPAKKVKPVSVDQLSSQRDYERNHIDQTSSPSASSTAAALGTADRSVCSNDSGYLSSESAKTKLYRKHGYVRGDSVPSSPLRASRKADVSILAALGGNKNCTQALSTCLTTQAEAEAIYINTIPATTTATSASSSRCGATLPTTSSAAVHLKVISCYNLPSAAAAAADDIANAAAAGDHATQPSTTSLRDKPAHDATVVQPPAAINQVQVNEKNSNRRHSCSCTAAAAAAVPASLQHFSSSNGIASCKSNITQPQLLTSKDEHKHKNEPKPETSSATTFANDNDRHCSSSCRCSTSNIITCDCASLNCSTCKKQLNFVRSDIENKVTEKDLHFPPSICSSHSAKRLDPNKNEEIAVSSPIVAAAINRNSTQIDALAAATLRAAGKTTSFPNGATTNSTASDNCCQSCAFHCSSCCRCSCSITSADQQQSKKLQKQQQCTFNTSCGFLHHHHDRDLSHLTDCTLSSSSSASTSTTTSNSFMSSTNSTTVASSSTVVAKEADEEEASKKEHALFLKFLRARNIACTFLLPTANKIKNNNNFSSPTNELKTIPTCPVSNLYKSHKSSSKTAIFYDGNEQTTAKPLQEEEDKSLSCASPPYFASGIVGSSSEDVEVKNPVKSSSNPAIRLRRSSTSKKILNNLNRIRLQHSKSATFVNIKQPHEEERKNLQGLSCAEGQNSVKAAPEQRNNLFRRRRTFFCPQPSTRPKSFCNASDSTFSISSTAIPVETNINSTTTTTVSDQQAKALKDKYSSFLSRSFEFLSSSSSSPTNRKKQSAVLPSVLFSPESDNPDLSLLDASPRHQPVGSVYENYTDSFDGENLRSFSAHHIERSLSSSLSNLSVCYDSLDDLLNEARTIMNHFASNAGVSAAFESNDDEKEERRSGQGLNAAAPLLLSTSHKQDELLQSKDGTIFCGEEEAEDGESGDDCDTVIVQQSSNEFAQNQHHQHALHELDDRISLRHEQHEDVQLEEQKEIVWQRINDDEFSRSEPTTVQQPLYPVKLVSSKPKIPRKPTFLRLRAQQQQHSENSFTQSSPATITSSSNSSATTPTYLSLPSPSADTLATQLLQSTDLVAVDIPFNDENHIEEENGGAGSDDDQDEVAIYSDDMMDHPQACGLPPANMVQKFRLRLTERDMNRPLSTQQQLAPGQTIHSFQKHTTWTSTKSVLAGSDMTGAPRSGVTAVRSSSSSSSSSSPFAEDWQQQRQNSNSSMRPSPLTITKIPITHHPRIGKNSNMPADSSHQYVNTANEILQHSSSFPTTPTSISNETYGRTVADNNISSNSKTRYFHHTRQHTDTSDELHPATSSTAVGGRYVKYKAYDSRELDNAANIVKPTVIYRDSVLVTGNSTKPPSVVDYEDDAATAADDEEQESPATGTGTDPLILERSSSKRGSKMGRTLRDSMRLKARRSNVTSEGTDANVVAVPSARDNDESLSSSTEICESVIGSSSSSSHPPPHTIKQQPIILARNHRQQQQQLTSQYQNVGNNRASFVSSALPIYRPFTSSPATRPYSSALSASTLSLSSSAIARVAPVPAPATAAKNAPPPPQVIERQLSVESTANPPHQRYRSTPRAQSHHNIHQHQQQPQQHRVQFADMPQIFYTSNEKGTRRETNDDDDDENIKQSSADADERVNPVINHKSNVRNGTAATAGVNERENANELLSSTTNALRQQQQQHAGIISADVKTVSSGDESSSDRLIVKSPPSSTSNGVLNHNTNNNNRTTPSLSGGNDDDRDEASSSYAADLAAAPAVPIKRRPKDFHNNHHSGLTHHYADGGRSAAASRIRNSQSWMSALHTSGGHNSHSATSTANDAETTAAAVIRSGFNNIAPNAVTPGADGPPAAEEANNGGGLRHYSQHPQQQQQRLYASVTSLSTVVNDDSSNSTNATDNEPLAAALRAFAPDDLLKTKEHLVERIETKLVVLKEEQTLLNEDISATDQQLTQYAERIRQQAKSTSSLAGGGGDPQQLQLTSNNNNSSVGQRLYEKFLDYVNEKERVTRLLLALATRMVRSQQQQFGKECEAITPGSYGNNSSSEAEKGFGGAESMRNNTVQQRVLAHHRDAQTLKQRVDERGAVLMRTLAADALSAPAMYDLHKLLTLRSQLITDAHDLRVKIVNADEQLTNLKLLAHPMSGVVVNNYSNSSSAQPSSSGVDRRSVFGSVSSLLSMPSSSSPLTLQPNSSTNSVVVHSKTPSSASSSSNGTVDSLESGGSCGAGDKNTKCNSDNGYEDNNKHLRQTSASSWAQSSTFSSMSTDV